MSAPAAEWTNQKLVEHCLKGDERAWRVLVDRYKNLVYSVPLKYGAPREDAADIFQAVWLDFFHELPRLRDADALQAWLVRVTLNKCHHWKRSQETAEVDLDVDSEQPGTDGNGPPGMLSDIEREQMIREAVDELPPRCREMIELLFFEHPPLRYAEVARRLRLAPGSIGFIRGRCLKRLKNILQERGF